MALNDVLAMNEDTPRRVDPADLPTCPLDVVDSSAPPSGISGGQLIDGKYELLEPAGQGGMSVVFRATDLRLKRTVAIKIMHPRETNDTRFWESFSREAESMARLRHRNVIEIYDIGRLDGFAYLVMPYHEGDDLIGWASRHHGPPVAVDPALRLLTQACDGVHALHEHGVMHGDIKPSNILVSSTLDVRVADLGMAWHVTDPRSTANGGGTMGFMAPELLLGRDEPDQAFKADVYGLAVTTYWLLTGSVPAGGGDMLEIMRRQLGREIVPPSERNPALPSSFDAPLLRALDPRPDARPNAREFRDALLTARGDLSEPIRVRSRIVIVDDDPNSLMLVEEIVRCAVPNAELSIFEDPIEALASLQDDAPSLIITDLHMPGLSGAELVTALRARPKTHQTPIIVMTGVGSAIDWQALASLGAHRFLVKPIAEDMLHDMVLRAVAAPTMAHV